MSSIRIVSLLAAGLIAGIDTLSAADVPVRPKQSHAQLTDNRRPRSSNPTPEVSTPKTEVSTSKTEALFREFLEWLKKQ